MTRHVLLGMAALCVGALSTACGGEADVGDEEIEVLKEEQAGCAATCAQFYRACIRWGDDPETCAIDRDACMEECANNTCEPGEPECCADYPWDCSPFP